MKKSFLWVIIGVIAAIAIGAYYATSSSIPNSDLDLQRMHGTVDTARVHLYSVTLLHQSL